MEEENKVIEEPKKKGNGSKVIIIILSIIIILLLALVTVLLVKPDIFKFNTSSNTNNIQKTTDKKANNDNNETETTDKKANNDNNETETTKDSSSEEIKPLDVTKSLNTTGYTYSSVTTDDAGGTDYKLILNEDKRSAIISLSAKAGQLICNAIHSTCGDRGYNITVSNFNKNIKSTYVGGLGQSAVGTVFYFLMDDGTVQYIRLLEQKPNPDGTFYYVDTTREKPKEISNINGIVQLYGANSNAPMSTGSYTTLAAKKDGSFYDLSQIIK